MKAAARSFQLALERTMARLDLAEPVWPYMPEVVSPDIAIKALDQNGRLLLRGR